jgi:predicted phage tail protein
LPTLANPPCANSSKCIGLKGTAVIAQPHLTYTPLATAFGAVAVGKSVTRSFSVTNDGNLPVTIVKAKAPVSAFTSTKPIDEGTTIPVGDVVHVNITFAPAAVGVKTDHYSITPNAGSGATTIAFSGTGIDVPSVPTLVRVTPSTKSVRITWAPPTSTGGLTVTGYRVTASPGGRTCTTTSTGRACSVTNLVNGTRYTFAVRAVNSLGASKTPATTGVVRVGAPTAPRSLKVIGRSTGATTLSWLTPSSAGAAPITYYQLQLSSDGGRTWSKWTSRSIGPGRVAHLTALTKGITYRLNVHAVNSYGDGVNAALAFVQTT